MPNWFSATANSVSSSPGRVGSFVRQILKPDQALSFSQVNALEREEVNASRVLRNQPHVADNLVGVAFSGGGIRSATFNLGILQGLAKRGYLRQIDYISTISGGGYIGAWLAAWIRRAGSERVQQRLKENEQVPPPNESGRYLEPDQLRFLRKYSSYLTPRAGLLSTDTWAAVAVYLRNLILNLVLLVASGVCLLLIPDFVLWAMKTQTYPCPRWLLAIVAVALLLLMAVIGLGFGALSAQSPARKDWRKHIINHAGIWTAGPLFVAAVAATLLLGFSNLPLSKAWQPWVLCGAVFYFVLWFISTMARWWGRSGREPKPVEEDFVFRNVFPILITLLVGALQGCTTYWIWCLFQCLSASATVAGLPLHWGTIVLVVFGPPLLVGTALLTGVLHTGLAGRALPDASREWLARAAAVWSLVALGWIILLSATLYGPLLIKWLTGSQWAKTQWGKVFKWGAAAVWAAITGGGIAAGRSAATSGNGDGRFKLIAKVAPPVFAAGLVLLLSFGLDNLLVRLPSARPGSSTAAERPEESLERLRAGTQQVLSASSVQQAASAVDNLRKMASAPGAPDMHDLAQQHWHDFDSYLGCWLLWVLVPSAFIAWIMGDRVDVNEFSMHLFYRNRLTRAYLGASQFARQGEPFIGFSTEDDVELRNLRTAVEQEREPLDDQSPPASPSGRYDGPYPIFNTALNLVRGKELAWQKRKAASFVYTPLFCGYDYFASRPGWVGSFYSSAYRPTKEFGRTGGLHLGTAVAVSGAAASPNMGFHTSTGLAFLMTVFNARLGWWAGNPRHRKTWRRLGPAYGLLYLFREIFPTQ